MFKLTTKFLIVDDFSNMRKIIKKILRDVGYVNALEAADGYQAYQLLVEYSKTSLPIEFVIADWNMPTMSGIELLKKCREEATFKTIPFMFVTAEGEQKQISKALLTGATEYVVKPFSPAQLKEKLVSSFNNLQNDINNKIKI